MPDKLPNPIGVQVQQLRKEADDLVAASRFDAAIMRYKSALDLLPSPKTQWRETLSILDAMIEACFRKGDFPGAENVVYAAQAFPADDQPATLRLRMGQVFFENGKATEARQELSAAFSHGGRQVFEHEDPKYLRFLESEAS